jgi:hypothetical protein
MHVVVHDRMGTLDSTSARFDIVREISKDLLVEKSITQLIMRKHLVVGSLLGIAAVFDLHLVF